MLQRVATAINAPSAIFVLAGTNDLPAGASPATTASRLTTLVAAIRQLDASAPIRLQSVMPRQLGFRDEIHDLNRRLEQIALATESVNYLDLWPVLADERGALRSDLTDDGLHLNGAGYAAWVQALTPWLPPALASEAS